MRKYLAALLALALVAAAFFLPVRLARWGDAQLLDVPHITAEEEREGFAETLQLTSGEKLLLLRSGDVSGMDVGTVEVPGLFTTPIPGENGAPGTIEHGDVRYPSGAGASAELYVSFNLTEEEKLEAGGEQLDLQLWDDRVTSAWSEVRTLQSLGGLPELWTAGSSLEFLVYGDRLYVDSATHVSFQTYRVTFSCAPYSLDMTVDAQSGRIFAFLLTWDKTAGPNWGLQGSGSFGTAWRDYWRLDKIRDTWYTPYTKEVLECPEAVLNINGEYNANDQVVFSYDSQDLAIPLINYVYSDKGGFLRWNT